MLMTESIDRAIAALDPTESGPAATPGPITDEQQGQFDERCPKCGHWLTNHTTEQGCMIGWRHPEQGAPALAEGCFCMLAHVEDSPGQREIWSRHEAAQR